MSTGNLQKNSGVRSGDQVWLMRRKDGEGRQSSKGRSFRMSRKTQVSLSSGSPAFTQASTHDGTRSMRSRQNSTIGTSAQIARSLRARSKLLYFVAHWSSTTAAVE